MKLLAIAMIGLLFTGCAARKHETKSNEPGKWDKDTFDSSKWGK